MRRAFKIKIVELPKRSTKLSPTDFEIVFGGSCGHYEDLCDNKNKCCDPYVCTSVATFTICKNS
jgi:hypothetical protein